MVDMASTRFSMRIDTDLKKWLEEEASRCDRSASYIASHAIKNMKEVVERKRQIIEEAIIEADKGVFISEEKMDAWVNSWDKDNELSMPEPDVFLHNKK